MAPTPVLLPGKSQGRGSLVGCPLWGRAESDTPEATPQRRQHCSLGRNVNWHNRCGEQYGGFLTD